ncbi:MAG: transcription repressor NadR [Sulfobacillus acidophilus]|uniref:Transcription repressor NadR n=1 Tax=Sulfobacillus acidophilus TaxID=53633 RepID=A0A2T2WID1_9FIRM|nr:MAG: transcription repressor NadR [Sulfobacillus acidophilus]
MNERQERQERILQQLASQEAPLRGEDLARQLGVTRQVVVHEIALLRAAGSPIVSTPRGYYLRPIRHEVANKTVIAVRHQPEQTRDELYALVDHGLVVENVLVEHPVYGELSGGLHLRSRFDVDQFLEQVESERAMLLSTLTQGYHLHTVRYPDAQALSAAVAALRNQAIEVFD